MDEKKVIEVAIGKKPLVPDHPDVVVDEYLHGAVTVDPILIRMEYERVSADLAYVNTKFADAQRESALAKLNVKETMAEAEKHIRLEIEKAAQKKPTEAAIAAEVLLSPAVGDANRRLIEAEYSETLWRGYAQAVLTKRDMLVSIGAHVRAEMQGDPVIREEQRSFNNNRMSGG